MISRVLAFVRSIWCSWYQGFYFGAVAAIYQTLTAAPKMNKFVCFIVLAANVIRRRLTTNHPNHPQIILVALQAYTTSGNLLDKPYCRTDLWTEDYRTHADQTKLVTDGMHQKY